MKTFFIATIICIFGLSPALLMFINASGCDYHINGTLKKGGNTINYDGVCNNGFTTFIETNETTGSEWRVNAVLLSWSDYLFYIITDRTQISSGNHGMLDRYNDSMNDFTVINVTYFNVKNSVIMIQTSPTHSAVVMEKEGYFSFMDKLRN